MNVSYKNFSDYVKYVYSISDIEEDDIPILFYQKNIGVFIFKKRGKNTDFILSYSDFYPKFSQINADRINELIKSADGTYLIDKNKWSALYSFNDNKIYAEEEFKYIPNTNSMLGISKIGNVYKFVKSDIAIALSFIHYVRDLFTIKDNITNYGLDTGIRLFAAKFGLATPELSSSEFKSIKKYLIGEKKIINLSEIYDIDLTEVDNCDVIDDIGLNTVEKIYIKNGELYIDKKSHANQKEFEFEVSIILGDDQYQGDKNV